MRGETATEVKVELAGGVRGDISELTALSAKATKANRAEVELLKSRIAGLFLECEANPYAGELMGSGRHPELADCRRIRFDIESHRGKPRFRLIYRNEPTDGAPGRCLWLAIGPRAGLRAHRSAERRVRRPADGGSG